MIKGEEFRLGDAQKENLTKKAVKRVMENERVRWRGGRERKRWDMLITSNVLVLVRIIDIEIQTKGEKIKNIDIDRYL